MGCLLVACGSAHEGSTDGGPLVDAAVDAAVDAGDVCEGRDQMRPDATPSNRTVRFHVTGPPDAYVLTSGMFCTAFGVDAYRLAEPFNCGCECPAPLSDGRGEQIGAALTIEWDANRLLGYQTCVDCAAWGAGGRETAYVTNTVPDAVEPGTHTLTLLVFDTAPAGCTVTETSIHCSGEISALTDGSLCILPGAREVTVEFDLPATGDVDVDVVIPAP